MGIPSLTQDLRDEIIQDIKDLEIPNVLDTYIRKMGAFPQTKAVVLVSVEDELETQNIADNIRLMVVNIVVGTIITQDRDGDFLDEISSYIEKYVREPRQFAEHAGYRQCRMQQMTGQSRRIDQYGQEGWFLNNFEMTVPYLKVQSGQSASV